MSQTKIEWCDKVWNPITGCSPVSDGCKNCYAKRMAYRLKGRYGYPKDDPFKVTFHPDRLEEPLHWKKPSRVFVCSMGDLFHKDVKEEWMIPIMHKIRLEAKHHTYLFLTKRPQNIENYFANWFLPNLKNLWLGVSVEDQQTADERIPILLQIQAARRFVSVEPMLGSVDLSGWLFINEKGDSIEPPLQWMIAGGETGPHARPLHPDWVRSLRDQCQATGVPFFFKSWGEWFPVSKPPSAKFYSEGKLHDWHDGNFSIKVGKKKAGRLIDSREWNEIPK
jgi:protein gp37